MPVSPAHLLPPQVYGQKEIYEISQDPEFQLHLLDNYVAEDIKPLNERETQILRRLKENGTNILRMKEQVATAEERLAELGAVQEALRREKERRQFIIATHNANIPVSGDTELIVVVNADENHGWVEKDGVGSIDARPIKQAVEQILEGGERAFQIRREKYGII